MAPSRGFDPPAEEALRWAILLATISAKRSFSNFKNTPWITIRLRSVDAKMSYLLEADSPLLDALLQRLPTGVTVREPAPLPVLAYRPSASAFLRLPARPRAVPTDPDPLGDFAKVFASVAASEHAEIVLDLERAERPSRDAKPVPSLRFAELVSVALTADPLRYAASPKVPRGAVAEAPPTGEVFLRTSVSAHAFADDPVRARELAAALLAPLHAWEPGGSLRVVSGGTSGPDALVSRRPRGRSSRVVPEAAIRGLLLPPTARCASPAVARTAASAAVPEGVPLVGPGVWPLGTPEGWAEPFGVPAREVLFSVVCGQPEYGKTQEALTQIAAQTLPWPGTAEILAGGAFIDPHMDGVRDLLPFYWQDPSRVLYMGLGDSWDEMRTPVYNPIDCRGVSPQEAERRVSAVVGGLSVAAGWDMKATRSLPIATKSVELLVAMARGLTPADPVPTVFQIPMVCMDIEARNRILRDERIPNSLRRWWENEGSAYKPDAFGPVTQIVSRIRSSVPLAAFVGGRSTFTPREAMDSKMIMLYGGLMSGDSEKDRLAVALFVRMLIQAAYSRGDVPREIRASVCPPFWCMIDELPTCDGADLPKIFMELRKFMFRCQVMAVTPAALKPATWAAAVTAASVITTTSLNGAGAGMLASLGLWKDFDPRDLGEIEKYHHLTSVTFRGRKHPPVAIKGMQPQDLFEARPGVVEASFPSNPRYRRVDDVMEDLEDLDERLLAAWTRGAGRSGSVAL